MTEQRNSPFPLLFLLKRGGRRPGWFVLIIILLSTSCLTVKKIERNCDKFSRVCVTATATVTEYRDTTIYITDTVYYTLPADTVTITETVQIIDNFCQLPTTYRRFGLINVRAGVNRSILNVSAWLTDSTILIPRRDTIFIDNAIQTTATTNTVVVEKKFIPKFYKFTFWVVMVQLLALVGFIAVEVIGLPKVVSFFKRK